MSIITKYAPEYCDVARKVLGDGESIAALCAELQIVRQTFYTWRDKHPEFNDAVEVGLMEAQRVWEKIGRDGITGEYDRFGGSPWIFTMKNRFRHDYQEEKSEQLSNASVIEKLIDKIK